MTLQQPILKHAHTKCPPVVVTAWVVGINVGGRVRKRRRETPASKAASFAFRPVFQLPIRISRELFCLTDFTRECIAKGGFVAVEKMTTERRRRDSDKNL